MRGFELRPAGAGDGLARRGDEEVVDVAEAGGERPGLRGRHDGEGGCKGAGFAGIRGNHRGRQDVFGGGSGVWVDDVGEVVAVDVDAATVGSAGGYGAVCDLDHVERGIVFGVGAGVCYGDFLAERAAEDDVATHVERDAGGSGGEGCGGCVAGDVALGEAVEGDGGVVEVGRGAGGAVELPVGLLHGSDGCGELLRGGLAMIGFGGLPDADGGLGGGVEGTVGLLAPTVEEGEDVEEFGGDFDGGVAGLEPEGELTGGLPGAEDCVFAIDLGEGGGFGLLLGCGIGGAELHLQRSAEDVLVLPCVDAGGRTLRNEAGCGEQGGQEGGSGADELEAGGHGQSLSGFARVDCWPNRRDS